MSKGRSQATLAAGLLVLAALFFNVSNLRAEGDFSFSGRLRMEGVYALDSDSREEGPSFTARVKTDWRKSSWGFHSWIEAGWDGTVRDPQRDHSLFKNFDEVYQDNTPYMEVKELYLAHSMGEVDLRIGLQRFSWGRLDEYPVNDLFNPWDYTRFIIRPMEERKIGVPAVSATMSKTDWTYQAVWVPWLVPYRLPKANERWSLIGAALSDIPERDVVSREPDLPPRTLENSSAGFRIQHMGEIDWAFDLFHGFDPRPVFRTTRMRVTDAGGELLIDPGYVPSFHKITSIGMEAACVMDSLSLRGEAAYAFGRVFDKRWELWGFPDELLPGTTRLNPVEVKRDTFDYGIAADYRLREDWMLTLQAQQTLIVNRPSSLYDRDIETLLWANLRVFWMNQKIETDLNLAYNPEHGACMLRPSAYYVFSDSWKAGILGLVLDGPAQSLFGRYSKNDQIEMELTYSW